MNLALLVQVRLWAKLLKNWEQGIDSEDGRVERKRVRS
jgi:hypothetical protein